MKKEISPLWVAIAIVIAIVVVGAYFATHLFGGPKIISGTPPPSVHIGPPPPPGFQFNRGQSAQPPAH